MEFVIDLPQTLSELKAIRSALIEAGQANSPNVAYIDQLLADIDAGIARPAPEKQK